MDTSRKQKLESSASRGIALTEVQAYAEIGHPNQKAFYN